MSNRLAAFCRSVPPAGPASPPALAEFPATPPGAPDLAWLGSVREVCYPLSRVSPIWMRESLNSGEDRDGLPFVPQPECHPCCEFTLHLEGEGTQYIGHERQGVKAGSVMLLGPHLPHTAQLDGPVHAITVYILPIVFLEMGPNEDGARILRRFTAEQPMAERVLPIPPPLLRKLKRSFVTMLGEFRRGGFGSELRVRSLLMEALVAFFRWEETAAQRQKPQWARANWNHIQRALHYLHEHHAEVIYVRQIAEVLRVGERQLNGAFRELLGMSCIQYLNEYRVSLAASRLSTSETPITTVAFEVGFETISHFNMTFRKVIGMSPTEYVGKKKSRRLTA